MPKTKEEETEEDLEEEETETLEEEESELEEDVKVNLQDLEFHQFLTPQDVDSDAPVLERIASGSPSGPFFVGGIPQGTPSTGPAREEDNGFKYMPSSEEGDDVKYMAADSGSPGADRVDMSRVGRTPATIGQEMGSSDFSQFQENLPGVSSPVVESFRQAERANIREAGREDSNKRDEEKYVKYKPSSY